MVSLVTVAIRTGEVPPGQVTRVSEFDRYEFPDRRASRLGGHRVVSDPRRHRDLATVILNRRGPEDGVANLYPRSNRFCRNDPSAVSRSAVRDRPGEL